MSAIVNEQRDLKKTWLAEKSDLQNRYFQIQSLNTQLNASLIKKEKEFVKLQNSLANVLKDKEKANKSTIIISSKLPGSSLSTSQKVPKELPNNGTTSVPLLNAEISSLKNTRMYLTNEIKQLQEQFSKIENQRNEIQQVYHQNNMISEEKILFLQQQIQELKEELEIQKLNPLPQSPQVDAPSASIFQEAPATNRKNPSNNSVFFSPPPTTLLSSPAPSRIGKIAKKYLVGTPGAKPMNVLLSDEEIHSQQTEIESNLPHPPPPPTTASKKRVTILETQYEELLKNHENVTKQLAEAMIVIKEQDRLIHEALISNNNTIRNFNELIFETDENDEEAAALIDKENLFKLLENEEIDFTKVSGSDLLPPGKYLKISFFCIH